MRTLTQTVAMCWIVSISAPAALAQSPREAKPAQVISPPAEVQKTLQLSPFYQKYLDSQGLAIVSSAKVSDAALVEANAIIHHLLAGRDDIRRELIKNRIRVAIMAPTELTTDLPEHSDLTPKDYWDKRARGLGATRSRPAISCGEENLLNRKGDRYANENILVHEFAHTMHEMGINRLDAKFDAKLREVFNRAKDRGLWRDTYAATNHKEYWAEGVQSYFDCNDSKKPHNTREKLAKYDPALFTIIDEVFGQSKWRYQRYDQRNTGKK